MPCNGCAGCTGNPLQTKGIRECLVDKNENSAFDHPQKPRTILIGQLIDGTGAPAKQNILMAIEKGRIIDMRPFLPGEAPPEKIWRNLADCTVLPPLIDCHVHLSISGSRKRSHQPPRRDREYEYLEQTITRHIKDCMENGVLGVRDGGDPTGNALVYKFTRFKDRENLFRLKTAGTGWHRKGRYGKWIGRAVPEDKDTLEVIEGEMGPGIDHIKLIQSGLNSLTDFGKQTFPQFDEDTIRRIYAFSRNRGIGLMVHANGEAPVAAAVAGGCDSIEHGYFMGDENLRKMADAQTAWVPTLTPIKAYTDNTPKDGMESIVAQRTLDHQLEQLARARQYGVTVALGTDAGSPWVLHGKSVSEELKLFLDAGYTLEEAIQCASMNAAPLMGNELSGRLAVGEPATLIAVQGNPIEVPDRLSAIHMMMVNGGEVDLIK